MSLIQNDTENLEPFVAFLFVLLILFTGLAILTNFNFKQNQETRTIVSEMVSGINENPGVALPRLSKTNLVLIGNLTLSSDFDSHGRLFNKGSIVVLDDVSQAICRNIFKMTQRRSELWQFNGKIYHGTPPLNLVCNANNQIAVKARRN